MMCYNRIFLFGLLLGSVCSAPAAEETDSTAVHANLETKKFHQETQCSRVGGICIERDECPLERVSNDGECPMQNGAVCCHSLSSSETLCHNLGGHCRKACSEKLIIARANNCDIGEVTPDFEITNIN